MLRHEVLAYRRLFESLCALLFKVLHDRRIVEDDRVRLFEDSVVGLPSGGLVRLVEQGEDGFVVDYTVKHLFRVSDFLLERIIEGRVLGRDDEAELVFEEYLSRTHSLDRI